MSTIGKNLERFRQAVFAHDRENPAHTAYGIGLSGFDMERLGFEEGETLWEGITVSTINIGAGQFRVLCDGDHADPKAREAQVTRAIGSMA